MEEKLTDDELLAIIASKPGKAKKAKTTPSRTELPRLCGDFLLVPMAEYIRASAGRAKEGTATDKELETLPEAVNAVACLLRTFYNSY